MPRENLLPLVRDVCRRHAIQLSRALGQHFLVSPSVLESMTRAADLRRGDTVVEVGAGMGILTKELLARAGHVIAIEVDTRWIPVLEEYTGKPDTLTIVRGNALREPMPDVPYKIVANIPYLLTSHLFKHVFLESEHLPLSLTLLVQKEVADKICNPPQRTMLTLLVSLFGEPRKICMVPPHAFFPPPNVESAIIHIRCAGAPSGDRVAATRILKLAGVAFSKRRKMLRRSIGRTAQGRALLAAAEMNGERRPETLSTDEWRHLGEIAQQYITE